jgi:hypothetical protein
MTEGNRRYDEAKTLIDRCVSVAKSMRAEHTARFAVVAENTLANLSWVGCEVLKLSEDPATFQDAVYQAVEDIEEASATDRTKTVHDVMRRLGVVFS